MGAPTLGALLPTLGPTPSRRPPFCDGGGPAASLVAYPSLPERAWMSEQVVVGRVTEQLVRAEVDAEGQPMILTYSLIAVEQRVRGQPASALVLVYLGGTLSPGCEQGSYQVRVQSGERRLFYLQSSRTRPWAYFSVGHSEGAGRITQDPQGRDWVEANGPSRRLLDEVLADVQAALSQPPPSGLREPIPLTQSPVAATPIPPR